MTSPSSKREQLVAFIAALNRATQEGSVRWQDMEVPSHLSHGEERVLLLLHAVVRGKSLALMHKLVPNYAPDFDRYVLQDCYVLAICDSDLVPIYEFPVAVGDLMESARYQASDAQGLMDEFLDDGA